MLVSSGVRATWRAYGFTSAAASGEAGGRLVGVQRRRVTVLKVSSDPASWAHAAWALLHQGAVMHARRPCGRLSGPCRKAARMETRGTAAALKRTRGARGPLRLGDVRSRARHARCTQQVELNHPGNKVVATSEKEEQQGTDKWCPPVASILNW